MVSGGRLAQWDKLASLSSAVEFAEMACERAASLGGGGIEATSLEIGDESLEHETVAVTNESVLDDEDEDDDVLLRMVQQQRARSGRHAGGGGGGGRPGKSRSRGKGKGKGPRDE